MSFFSAMFDKLGNLLVSFPGADPNTGRTLVEERNAANYISTAATTLVKTGGGLLHSVVYEGGTSGTIVIYDSLTGSGTVLASFDAPTALGFFIFDVTFSTGLTVVTAAASKVTVGYR